MDAEAKFTLPNCQVVRQPIQMGCDIHLPLEYQHPSRGVEPVIANFFTVGRDYRLFAALAGVRNRDNVPIRFPPRGFPNDASFNSPATICLVRR